MTTYGIIGNPVEHSLSPVMHNAAFEALGVEAVYKLFPLEEEELDGFFKQLKKKDSPIFGLNVTVPYKEKIMAYMDSTSPLAQKLGAINTVVITNERKLIGYNTDAPGFMAHLTELQFHTAQKRVTILGAGGSARAILATLCMIPERPESILMYNRTSARLQELVKDLESMIDLSMVQCVEHPEDLNIELADLLINTTSVGLREEDPLIIDPEQLHSNMLVYDLIYRPAETPLLAEAKARGARTANGLGMLYYQGILSFQHWANIQLDDKIKGIMRQALEEAAYRR